MSATDDGLAPSSYPESLRSTGTWLGVWPGTPVGVELSIHGRRIAQTQVTVPAGGTEVLVLRLP